MEEETGQKKLFRKASLKTTDVRPSKDKRKMCTFQKRAHWRTIESNFRKVYGLSKQDCNSPFYIINAMSY